MVKSPSKESHAQDRCLAPAPSPAGARPRRRPRAASGAERSGHRPPPARRSGLAPGSPGRSPGRAPPATTLLRVCRGWPPRQPCPSTGRARRFTGGSSMTAAPQRHPWPAARHPNRRTSPSMSAARTNRSRGPVTTATATCPGPIADHSPVGSMAPEFGWRKGKTIPSPTPSGDGPPDDTSASSHAWPPPDRPTRRSRYGSPAWRYHQTCQ